MALEKSNRFENDLKETLQKTRMPITVAQYMKRLRVLNGDKPIQSFKFLLAFDTIKAKIESMNRALSTRCSYLTAVCAVLSTNAKYSKLHKRYVDLSKEMCKPIQDKLDANEKTDTQKESLIPMKEILDRREALDAKIAKGAEWPTYMEHLALSLYTMIQPRRNKDYTEMVFVLDEPAILNKALNYYVLSEDVFLFNNYKTVTTYGSQRVKVPKQLADVLERYIDQYMKVVPTQGDGPFYLLVSASGKRINDTNGMTRILNRAIGKKVSSSALRHIFLSHKYAETLEAMKEDSTAMAHSLDTQKEYIKTS